VHADAEGEVVRAGGGLDAFDEGGGRKRLAEGEGFAGARRDVVGCFGEEEGLGAGGGGFSDELLALGEVVLEGGGGAELADCL
jgi:hypothetical protein